MRISHPFAQIAWVGTVLYSLPRFPLQRQFKELTEKLLHTRIAQGSERKDLYVWLLGEHVDTGYRMSKRELESDAILAVVAGSDTTSST
jgi:cytochrome P450